MLQINKKIKKIKNYYNSSVKLTSFTALINLNVNFYITKINKCCNLIM